MDKNTAVIHYPEGKKLWEAHIDSKGKIYRIVASDSGRTEYFLYAVSDDGTCELIESAPNPLKLHRFDENFTGTGTAGGQGRTAKVQAPAVQGTLDTEGLQGIADGNSDVSAVKTKRRKRSGKDPDPSGDTGGGQQGTLF